jgi:hypothetical protein
MVEEWRYIKDTEYEVSTLGNIRKSNIYYTKQVKNGYHYVIVNKKAHRLHRLVALTFIENDDPKNKVYVNHINGNKLDNSVKNLEWVTPSENNKHAIETKLNKNYKRTVGQFNDKGELLNTFESIHEASKQFGVKGPSIVAACIMNQKGKNARVKGFVWKYVDNIISETLTEDELKNMKQVEDGSNYYITHTGKVYNNKKKKLVSIRKTGDGYLRTSIRYNDKRHNLLVHRLVASCFIENPENKPYVNHKNKNRQDNNVINLEWVTNSENMIHALNN